MDITVNHTPQNPHFKKKFIFFKKSSCFFKKICYYIDLSNDGWMAEWSCSGLQLRVRRFDSDSSLHF